MKKSINHIDWFILLPIVVLMFFSLAFVYSASATISEIKFGTADNLLWKHILRVTLAFLAMLVFSRIDYHKWFKYSRIIISFGILLLITVLFMGTSAKGASRWLNLGFLSFQPSEFVKFAMVIHFASMLTLKQNVIKTFEKGFLPFMIWIGGISILIALQPNFSTMLVIFLIAMSMLFIGNTNLLHLSSIFFVGLFGAVIYAISAEYRLDRIRAFLGQGGSSASETISYQLGQALLAIGNGGLFGVGPGQNRQSHMFLPESYGDFIFSIIGEEFGFLGLFLILAMFAIVFWRGMLVAKKAPDQFGYFLAIGILVTFAIYVFVNAGVNTGLLPTTGVPMPFISYGGTAVIFYGMAIGILLNISSQAGVYQKTIINENQNLNINP